MTSTSVNWNAMNITNMNTPMTLWYLLEPFRAAPMAAHPTIDGMMTSGVAIAFPNSVWFTALDENKENATTEKNALCTE